MSTAHPARSGVQLSVETAPVIGVVRTDTFEEAARQARLFVAGGLELVEITFSVPRATELVAELLAERGGSGPPWIGMGTVTGVLRVEAALAAGAEFLITPNASPQVARAAKSAGVYFALGALTTTEIVTARDLGADLVKVYPLPPVGGPRYLSTVRQPLADIPMLAAGGFGVEEIPSYREAGAIAYGIGAPLLAADDSSTKQRIARALDLARGKEPAA